MKKRFISFVLSVLILLPFLPQPIRAQGFVKEIDVLSSDFKLQIEGRNVSSKELFIYDGELWVPLGDLSRALNLEFSFSNRNFQINSKGKLGFDDSSQAHVAFQRGYEIQAKERMIKELDQEIQAFQKGENSSNIDSDSSLIRNINVSFSNINISIDGKKVNLSQSPFIYNNDVYVSILDISPFLFITPSLKDNIISIDGNSVLLEKPSYNSTEDLAKFRTSLNNRLAIQLAEMEKRKEVLMEVKIPYENIKTLSQMEKYLNKYLDEIEDLPVSVSLKSGSNNWYYLDIDFPVRYNYRWRNLSRRDVEAYIWDIFVAINTLYDEEAKIQGNIRNPRYSSSSRYRDYVTFDTKMKDLIFSFINSGLDISEKTDPIFIEERLSERFGRYGRDYFDFQVSISGSDLNLVISPHSIDFMDRRSLDSQLRFLREIGLEIRRHYPSLKVNGTVEYSGEDSIYFLINNGKLRSSTLIDKTVDYLNSRYDRFTTDNLRIPMKYGFFEMNEDDYKLVVEMDFDKNDSSWDNFSDEALTNFIQNVIGEIVSLWDMNIFIQILDKNQSLVDELVASQDTVQAVTTNIISGNIEKGKNVRLYTNTPGADIYYTTDGSTPSESNGIKYDGPIIIHEDITIKAYAIKYGLKDSPVYEFKYTIIDSDDL